MKTRLIIDENTVYEVDEECLNRRKLEENKGNRECNVKAGELNNRKSVNNRNNNNRISNNRS